MPDSAAVLIYVSCKMWQILWYFVVVNVTKLYVA